ncbi:MAG: hypothetical protein WC959_08705 [Kiritimatiellales bacterium]
MELQSDFKELLGLLNAHGVEYLIVGGYALAFHGAPRFTGDLDIFIKTSPVNAGKVHAALNEFGFDSVGLKPEDFAAADQVIQLGVPPVRIDFVTSIDGVKWEDAWTGRVPGTYAGVPVQFLGRTEFLQNKKVSGRLKDLADIEALGEE